MPGSNYLGSISHPDVNTFTLSSTQARREVAETHQAAVGAIWRGDTAAIARISARYNPPMQLIGKLYRDGAGWKADWIFVDSGRVLARWSETGADARRTLASASSRAASTPAASGVPPPPGMPARLRLARTSERVGGSNTSALVPLNAITQTWSRRA